ncbi:STAS domain-containing protein [Isoptericola sp. NEAU-Y5]|uniref:STAS domain-containing protein n=1 Tax=Isoptericola luteus TaxID=2879484 RepID=A0ABS7ZIY1_9MICO|nr:STAS domain-containing protein [Isoptericola sp. NEAU-Y5]MCA5894989.1 STAS domain-containing protein [Isoptericola sp. NEAU-Y5]
MTVSSEARTGGIALVERPGASVVELWGEIDITLRNEAGAALAGAFQRDLPVVVDTSRVTFIDSAGVAFLVQLCRIGRDEGLNVTVYRPPQVVRETLHMLDLEITDTPSHASVHHMRHVAH